MSRYQIKILDGDLTDLIHELATRVTTQRKKGDYDGAAGAAYCAVFDALKATLKPYVRGFHVCGCRIHCDRESKPTELRAPGGEGQWHESEGYDSPRVHPSRIHRFVLTLDVPLRRFIHELEVATFRVLEADPIAGAAPRREVFRMIRDNVARVFGKYLYYCPECNREAYLCVVGECTEFDPWRSVAPRTAARATPK